jgi:hypothetical protein
VNNKIIFFAFIGVLGLTGCKGASNSSSGNNQVNSAAEVQLRDRVEAWYKETNRGGVNGGQCAISCHTTIPFMISNSFKSIENRVTADGYQQIVATRVGNWQNLQPYYSWSPEGSRGTEALANVATLLEYDRKVSGTLSEAACKALENLWPLQKTDGQFPWLDASLSPWEDQYAPYYAASMLSLSLGRMTSTLAGTTPSCQIWQTQTSKIQTLHQFLSQNYATANKHGQAWFLWANAAWNYGLLSPQEHTAKLAELLTLQRSDGGFDLKEFGPFERNAESPAMSQPYITGVMIKAMGKPTDTSTKNALAKAKNFMKNYSYSSITSLQSLNNPGSTRADGFFQDANLAFYLSDYE